MTSMTSEQLIRLALGAAVVVSFLVVSVMHRKIGGEQGSDDNSPDPDTHPLDVVLRGAGLALLSVLLVYLAAPGVIAWAQVPLPGGLRLAAVGLLLLVVPLAVWTRAALGANHSRTVSTRREHSLVTSGPYARVRHPLYSIGIFMWTCIALASASALLFALIALFLPLILSRIRREEANLLRRFGDDYRRYMERTGRLLPRPTQGDGP